MAQARQTFGASNLPPMRKSRKEEPLYSATVRLLLVEDWLRTL